MYCPVCFNDTLKLKGSGVIHLIVNGKQMDAGRFLYNLKSERGETLSQYNKKIEEFFRWYSNFKNQSPIQKVQLLTTDVICDTGCRLPLNLRISVTGVILSPEEIRRTLDEMAKKYSMTIELIEDA